MSKESKSFSRRIAVTGGAGFIGSNFLLMMVPQYSDYFFVNIDSLTYAANLANLGSISALPNYRFEKIDIGDFDALKECFSKHQINSVIHLAAESHVDRSIIGPAQFVKTNVFGTFNLLEVSRIYSESDESFRFHNVSTDEVYGSANTGEEFKEDSPYRPNSPYAASKAAADHLVRSYHRTYGLDVVTSNCSNNYGPYQFPEKLIPLVINNAINNKAIPVYGDGKNERNWIYVSDHCKALDLVFHKGKSGQTYNVSSEICLTNLDLIKSICSILDKKLGGGPRESLIQFVKDRPGHDRRYALDSSRLRNELGWKPLQTLDDGIEKTVNWYLENGAWLKRCVNGEYKKYYETMYANR